jgi:hypothetical protein
MFKKLFLILLVCSCSNVKKKQTYLETVAPPREFSRGELILANELLTKIFDQEMAYLLCVPDADEASLLLRTIRPRMEVVEDDLSAMMDSPKSVEELILTCDQNCTCGHIDELVREHLVSLTKEQRRILNHKKREKELNRCLNFVQSTFCQSELYKALDKEKEEFSFE